MHDQGESETNHYFIGSEGVAHEAFFEAYEMGRGAPWDVGEPQPAVLKAIELGWFASGPVLDAGCGTGVNVVPILESTEHDVVAVDCVPAALDLARERINELGQAGRTTFGLCDLRNFNSVTSCLAGIESGCFGSILDSGVLHVFSDSDRINYLKSLAQVAGSSASLVLLVFSDRETRPHGPRRMTRSELQEILSSTGWAIQTIMPHRYQSHPHPGGAEAWLVHAQRRV